MCGHLRSPGPPQHRCRGAAVRRGEKQNQKRRENREGNPSRAGEGGSRQPPPRPRLRRGRRPLSALTCPAGPRRPHLPGARRGGAALAEELTWRRPRAGAAAAGAPQVRRGSGLRARGSGLRARLGSPAAGPGGRLPQQVRGRPAAGFPRLSPQAAAADRSRAPKGLRSRARPSWADTPGPSGGLPGALSAGPERPGVCARGRCGEPRPAARSTWAVGAPGQPVFCQAG